jgi:hypothetical protein
MEGYVYIWGGNGVYKIGRAKNPEVRVRAFPVMPYPCDLIATFFTSNCIALEKGLHNHFKLLHIRGEWYGLSFEALQEAKEFVCKFVPPEKSEVQLVKRKAKADKQDEAVLGPIQPQIHRPTRDGVEHRLNVSKALEDFQEQTGLTFTLTTLEQMAGMRPNTFAKWSNPSYVLPSTWSGLFELFCFLRDNGFSELFNGAYYFRTRAGIVVD